ncbi:MAG: hypothetical protein ABI585_00310 [Betaproteobacteria bacterium]
MTPVSDEHPVSTPIAHPRFPSAAPADEGVRGERLVALCALAVLAIAAVFFVERLRSTAAPEAAIPAVTSPMPSRQDAAEPSSGRPGTVPAAPRDSAIEPTTVREERPYAPTRVGSYARPRRTPIATTRKPVGKADSRVALPSPRPAPIVVASAQVLPRPAGEPSRWDRMRDDVATCARSEFFFDAVLCDQRVRLHYCDAWWGRSAECPSGRQGDYGN